VALAICQSVTGYFGEGLLECLALLAKCFCLSSAEQMADAIRVADKARAAAALRQLWRGDFMKF